MDTRLAFTGLVGVVVILRLLELRVSKRNIDRLKARGAVEEGFGHYPWMVAIHSAWLASCLVEVWLFERAWIPILGITMAVVFVMGTILRHWTIATLGERWSTRVVYVSDDPIETGGPFRWLRHPNYFGVVLEIVALPLIHTAWLTAFLFSVANSVVLGRRLAVENDVLATRENRDVGASEKGRGGVVAS